MCVTFSLKYWIQATLCNIDVMTLVDVWYAALQHSQSRIVSSRSITLIDAWFFCWVPIGWIMERVCDTHSLVTVITVIFEPFLRVWPKTIWSHKLRYGHVLLSRTAQNHYPERVTLWCDLTVFILIWLTFTTITTSLVNIQECIPVNVYLHSLCPTTCRTQSF